MSASARWRLLGFRGWLGRGILTDVWGRNWPDRGARRAKGQAAREPDQVVVDARWTTGERDETS